MQLVSQCLKKDFDNALQEVMLHAAMIFMQLAISHSDGRYYRKSIEIIDTYKSIDTFDTRKKYR
jgi:hypothetical protein